MKNTKKPFVAICCGLRGYLPYIPSTRWLSVHFGRINGIFFSNLPRIDADNKILSVFYPLALCDTAFNDIYSI